MCAERPDGLPSCADEHDAFPEGSSILDRNLQRRFSIGILLDFRTIESSEGLRQSQLERVQNLPASVIPSELSAHQMAGSLTGTDRYSSWEDPLGHERVDGHPIEQLSLLDRALLRKYSVAALPDGSSIATDKTKVQSERDCDILREEEPQPIVEQVSAKPLEKEVSMVSVTCTDFSQMRADDRASKNAREQAKRRRRFTGKTFKSKSPETLIKDEPRDSLELTIATSGYSSV